MNTPAPVKENASSPDGEMPSVLSGRSIAPPTVAQQSWGAALSIVVILLMVIIGAFYAWGRRTHMVYAPATASTTP